MKYILIGLSIIMILLIIYLLVKKDKKENKEKMSNINKCRTPLPIPLSPKTRERRFFDTLTYDFDYLKMLDEAPRIHAP